MLGPETVHANFTSCWLEPDNVTLGDASTERKEKLNYSYVASYMSAYTQCAASWCWALRLYITLSLLEPANTKGCF